ncbi:hypothetical protein QAD02_008358 [Eretmocerus hayati]|uniref:Uncharacterized protein n=1 Tax=Eretmocerus hayati TaxID=131215 RepID=A0ACC2N6I0_9HYME|nr:hypothetical protein QAD02_008358 [Eretmocerus hayati]
MLESAMEFAEGMIRGFENRQLQEQNDELWPSEPFSLSCETFQDLPNPYQHNDAYKNSTPSIGHHYQRDSSNSTTICHPTHDRPHFYGHEQLQEYYCRPSDPKIPRVEESTVSQRHPSLDMTSMNEIASLSGSSESQTPRAESPPPIRSASTIIIDDPPDGPLTRRVPSSTAVLSTEAAENHNTATTPQRATSGNRVYHIITEAGITGHQIFSAYATWERTGNDAVFNSFRPALATLIMNQVMKPGVKVTRAEFVSLRVALIQALPLEIKNALNWYRESCGKRPATGFYRSAYVTLWNKSKYANIPTGEDCDDEEEGIAPTYAIILSLKGIKAVNAKTIKLWMDAHAVQTDHFKEASIDNYLNELPYVSTQQGLDLLLLEFSRLHKNKENAFLDNGACFMSAVVALAEARNKKRKDKEISDYLETYKNNTIVLGSFLTPLLFNGSRLPNSKIKRAATVKYFIEYIKVGAEENALDRLKTSQRDLKVDAKGAKAELTPRVVLCGDTLDSSQIFIALSDTTYYESSSLIEAIDRCFKCMFEFPSCKSFGKLIPHVWALIESCVYKISNPEHFHPVMTNVISDLKYLRRKLIEFTLDIYGIESLPRSFVDDLVRNVQSLIKESIFPFLKQGIRKKIESKCSRDTCGSVDVFFDESENLIDLLSTEYERIEEYKKEKLYIPPEEIEVGRETTYVILNNLEIRAENVTRTIIHAPIDKCLTKLLETPGLVEMIDEKTLRISREKDEISDIRQGKAWKANNQIQKRNRFPLHIFIDDFNPGNGLGSTANSQKLSGVYISLPFLPDHMMNKNDSIILVSVFKSKYRAKFGNKAVFQRIIEELNNLGKNGLDIRTSSGIRKFYFQLTLVVEDNLALNEVCGFQCSFIALRYCRICIATKQMCKEMCDADASLIRDAKVYDELVKLPSVVSGLREECVWNQVDGYHIGDNPSVDLMHDVMGGIIPYTLSEILTELIFNEGHFSLGQLNLAIKKFNFGSEKNKPQPLLEESAPSRVNRGIKRKEIKIRMSAAESLSLLLHLGLIIGDEVPHENKYWKLYLTLRRQF